MSLSIKGPKDFWTGVMYIGFGGIAFVIAQGYSFGSAGRMGPGYFPTVLSCLLMLFGVLVLLRGLRREGPVLGGFAWKPVLIVSASTLAFSFLLEGAGLIVALFALIFGSAAASAKFRFEWKATLLALALIVFCALVFIAGLGLPMSLLGTWFGA
jgi:hypothetical protein